MEVYNQQLNDYIDAFEVSLYGSKPYWLPRLNFGTVCDALIDLGVYFE
jgi:hypothetical protein